MSKNPFKIETDGETVTITGDLYRDAFNIDRLDGWTAFYGRMAAKYARGHYRAVFDALKKIRKEIDERPKEQAKPEGWEDPFK